MEQCEIKCIRCQKELYKLNKFTPQLYTGTETTSIGDVYQLILFASTKGIFKDRLRIIPEIYICLECGHVEYILNNESIHKVKRIEADNTWKTIQEKFR